MPRLGTKISGYRPATNLISVDNKVYNFLDYVSLHLGFESSVETDGNVPDLSGNGHTGQLLDAVSVSTAQGYPGGVLPRGSLNFDISGLFNLMNYMRVSGSPKFAVNRDFSVSFWLMLSDVAVNQTIIRQGLDGDFRIIYLSTNKQLGFRWYEKDNSTAYFERYVRMPSTTQNYQWVHVAFSYSGGDKAGDLNPDLTLSETAKFYFDGDPSTGSSSTFINSWTGNGIAVNYDDIEFIVSAPAFGDIYPRSFGSIEWWSKALTSQEVKAIYQAQVNEDSSIPFNSSGFISRSPRLHLRELDDNPGAYPTILRSGDSTRTGALATSFDDGSTIIFSNNGNPVFPSMLPDGSSFSSQAVDIIGQESDISASLPIRSFQQPTYLHYSPTEAVGPFNENRVMPATDFFLSGTSIDIMPGFSSPLRSKIAIEIDITPQSDVTITRNVSSRNSSEGQPVSSDNTGFYYFNFSASEWNEIGKTDPATGGSLYYDFAINDALGLVSGTFPSQFTFGNCSAKIEGGANDNRLELGYSKIGSPTVVMGAPSLPKYHATEPQSLKLSNLISSPFMLEAVTVDFGEIIAQRTNGGATGTNSSVFKSGSIRDIDNYVFFMYRQNRANRVIDSVSDVSSSSRYLVCSASMTFWNSASLSGSGWSPATLLHSPAFSYEFGLPYNDSYQIGSYTGSVSLNMRPAICGPQQLGVSRVPQQDGTGTKLIQNSWGGGSTLQSVELFGDAGVFPRPFDSANGETLTDVIERAFKIDSRTIRKLGGEDQDQTTENLFGFGFVSITTPQSNESPYLLFPEDEIIFGLEAGIPQPPFANLVSNLTGSHLRVGSKPCKVTLFGSMVIDGVEKLPSLNQNLSSNSVHEIIGAEPVLDQFQIEPRSSYYGSYLDEIVTGSMATLNPDGTTFTIYDQDNSRRVIGRKST